MGITDVWKAIRQQGGLLKSIKALYIRDSLKHGTLMGTDDYGNKYYENNDYFFTRNRWVEYSDHVGLNYDASQVPAEWFGWLHHRTDLTPDKEPYRPKYHWMMRHEENMSGSPGEYVPYTTTRPVIHPWKPPPESAKLGASPAPSCGDDSRKGCEERDGEEPPPKCEEEETPPKCRSEEGRRECDENKDKRCEKPDKAFH